MSSASLAPGGPVQKLSLVAPRSPGVQQPPLSLSTGAGLVALVADTLPVWAIMLAIVLITARRGQRGQAGARPRRGLIAFSAALAGFSILGLTKSDVNGGPPEPHRFLTAALFLFRRRRALPRQLVASGNARPHAGAGGADAGRGFDGAVAQSLSPQPDPGVLLRQRGKNLHTSDCRAVAGARFGQRPAVSYVEASVFYAYAACPPSFVAGRRATSYWTRKEYRPWVSVGFSSWTARCWRRTRLSMPSVRPDAGRETRTRLHLRAARPGCVPRGSDYVRCPLAPGKRRAIAGGPAPARH